MNGSTEKGVLGNHAMNALYALGGNASPKAVREFIEANFKLTEADLEGLPSDPNRLRYHKTLARGIELLKEQGYLTTDKSGWHLTDSGKALIAPVAETVADILDKDRPDWRSRIVSAIATHEAKAHVQGAPLKEIYQYIMTQYAVGIETMKETVRRIVQNGGFTRVDRGVYAIDTTFKLGKPGRKPKNAIHEEFREVMNLGGTEWTGC